MPSVIEVVVMIAAVTPLPGHGEKGGQAGAVVLHAVPAPCSTARCQEASSKLAVITGWAWQVPTATDVTGYPGASRVQAQHHHDK